MSNANPVTNTKIKTAMILAAGKGERMRPLTEHTPKPLLKAGAKPLIEHHIESLALAGIEHIVINLHWLGAQIEEAIGSGKRFGVAIQYSKEDPILETAGGIANALPLLRESTDGPFILVNGDVWSDFNFSAFTQRPEAILQNNDLAALVMVENPEHNPKGDFVLENNRLIESALEESGKGERLTYSGIGLYRPEMFSDLPIQPAPLGPILRVWIAKSRIAGLQHHGNWSDIGTPQRLQQLNKELGA